MRNKFIAVLFSFSVVLSAFSGTTTKKQEKITELSKKEQNIVLISADTALGDMDQLKLDLEMALNNKALTVNEIKEVLVQMYAYCGFPRSLNAKNKFLEVVKEREKAGIKDKMGRKAQTPYPERGKIAQLGKEIRTKLVGSDKKAPYAEFVPVIDYFLIKHLFGDIFILNPL